MIKIGNTWYNKNGISQMTFEEFCSTCPNDTKDKQRNIYEQVTGKKVEEEKPKKESNKKKEEEKEKVELSEDTNEGS